MTQLICWASTGASVAKEPAVLARVSKEAVVSIFMTEETGLSTLLVPVYKTARRHIPGGNSFEEGRSYVLLPQHVAQHEFCDTRMKAYSYHLVIRFCVTNLGSSASPRLSLRVDRRLLLFVRDRQETITSTWCRMDVREEIWQLK